MALCICCIKKKNLPGRTRGRKATTTSEVLGFDRGLVWGNVCHTFQGHYGAFSIGSFGGLNLIIFLFHFFFL